jgi:hypothetical protein
MPDTQPLSHVEFCSDLFRPYPGEEEETNPGRYGKRLAEFLIAGLTNANIVCKAPVAEDWGWRIDVQNDAFTLWIGVGVYEEYPDGFLCFIEPHEAVIRKFFRKIDTRGPVEALQRAMDKVLSAEPGIRNVHWTTHGEFNGPTR